MQLVTIECREVAGRPGVITSNGEILDLVAAPTTLDQAHWIPQSAISILAAGEDGRERVQRLLDSAADADAETLRANGVLLPTAQTQLMAPVRRPGLVLVQENRAAAAGEPDPVVSIKSPNTVVGPSNVVRLPWQSSDGTWVRPLLGIVLGRALHLAGAEEAAGAVAALTMLFDISPPQPGADGDAAQWRRYIDSKQFPGACPIGPTLVTWDEWPPGAEPECLLSVNGVEIGRARLRLDELPTRLAALSARYGFRPGDVVGFDLPMGLDDQRNAQDGDRVRLALPGVPPLDTTISF